jgi:hypothetical protein
MTHSRRNLSILLAAAFALIIVGALLRGWLTAMLALQSSPITIELDYVLNGETDEDAVVVAQNLTVAPDAVVNGDASLIAANLLVDGTINGDLTAIADSLTLGASTNIAGNAALMGQQIVVDGVIGGDLYLTAQSATIADSAVISGTIYPCGVPAATTADRETAPCNAADQARLFDSLRALQTEVEEGISSIARAIFAFIGGLALIGLSVLGITLFPSQIEDIETRARGRLRDSFSAGIALLCLAVGAAALVTLLLAIFPPLGLLALIPFLFANLILFGLLIAGWLVAAHSVGRRVLRRSAQPPMIAVLVGGLILTAGGVVLALLPGGEWWMLLGLVLVSAPGAGATLLRRLGSTPPRRAYFVQG